MARTALVNVMVQAVLKAGRGLARDFGEVENLQVSLKGPADFVSAADRRADETLIAELRKARPGYGFLTEENGTIEGSDPTHRWIIDPLDGTTNFLHGIPLFAISVGLERSGQMVAGVVYNPVMNELFVAERGGGAFLNDRRLRVSSRTELIDSVIATAMPHVGRNNAAYLGELEKIIGKVAGVRRSGSSALDLAWLAAGRYDGLWQHGLQPWDLAAGLVLVREAGGFATDRKGGADIFGTGTVVAGNEAIHRRLLDAL
jgi:myo-inositol-1(or 4)-monophosphatase